MSLKGDFAVALARAIFEVVERCIPPGQHQAAMDEFVEACEAGIEAYELRREFSINPSEN